MEPFFVIFIEYKINIPLSNDFKKGPNTLGPFFG
jgi:hypothetical protein